MPKHYRLSAADQHFFRQLDELVSSNPFGVNSHGPQHAFDELLPELQQRLGQLTQRHSISRLTQLAGQQDQALLASGYLFQCYSAYRKHFDQLIKVELTDQAPTQVDFAQELIAQLHERGFAQALRHFEQFYQLRRAYYFIDRSLIGSSAVMKKLRFDLWNSVFSYDIRHYDHHLHDRMEDFSTLLVGATGAGKGAAAAALGYSGYIPFDLSKKRFRYPIAATFNAINLAEFPESLIESELFGHRKGAFTGAVDNYQGVFGNSHANSTLFLDEIADASVNIQLKLLRVLQERNYTPVGSRQPARFSGRVIAATNRPVTELRHKGRLREDFYYRLSANVITIPTLHQRIAQDPQELNRLVATLLQRMISSTDQSLIDQVLKSLSQNLPADYQWPGNVRELEQAIRRILLTREYSGDDFSATQSPDQIFLQQLRNGELSTQALLSKYCALLYQRYNNYQEVARRTGLDWRTVQKHVRQAGSM